VAGQLPGQLRTLHHQEGERWHQRRPLSSSGDDTPVNVSTT
jgi:hypothetical protein